MTTLFLLLSALCSASNEATVPVRAEPRAVGYEPSDEYPSDKIVYTPMTEDEWREWYGRDITRILNLHRKKQ